MNRKIELRNSVELNKDLFNKTNDTRYIAESAIAYGVYTAIGGTKVVALPPFITPIYKIINTVASVKSKVGRGVTLETLNKIRNILVSNISNLDNILLVSKDKYSAIVICLGDRQYEININLSIAAILSLIATLCITDTGLLTDSTDFLYDTINNYISDIGRF